MEAQEKCVVLYENERKFELWQVKFLRFLRLQKMHDVSMVKNPCDDNGEENAEVFALLLQRLEERC